MSETEVNSFYETNGWKVHFEKFGSGPNIVLLIPGAIGTAETDFEELLDDFDGLDFDKFTIIAIDAPGLGQSRPPLRKYGINVYNIDSECFQETMKHLGYDKYSIIGFSEGARVALLMAAQYPRSVQSLVLSSMRTRITNNELSAILQNKSVNKWSQNKVKSYLKVYKTEEEIQKMWNRFIKFFEFHNQYFPEDIFKDKYELVRCPVLITHGDKDSYIEVEQAVEVCDRLYNAMIYRFPLGDHDCHQKYSIQYVKLVQDHFLIPTDYKAFTREKGTVKELLDYSE